MPLSARFRIARDFRFKRARSIVKYRLDREKFQTGIFHAGSESLRASSELDVSRGDRSRRALIGRNATRNTTGSLQGVFLRGGGRVRWALLHPSSTRNTSNTTTSKMSAIAAVGLPALRAPVRAARRTTASKVRTDWEI